MSAALQAALEYARQGRLVFPTAPGLKVPAGCPAGRRDPHPGECGFKHATGGESQIRAWWTAGRLGVAVRTGACSGLVVVDVDTYKPGAARLEQLELPPTRTVTTPSGGTHLWFAHPGGEIRSVNGRLADGVDVKADGGYVVAPPTVIGGRAYTFADPDVPLEPLPTWVADRLRPPAPPPRPSAEALARTREQTGGDYLRERLRREAGRVAATRSGEGLHDRVRASARLLGGFVHAGLTEAEIVGALVAAAGGNGKYSDAELRRTAEWGVADGIRRPLARRVVWADRPEGL